MPQKYREAENRYVEAENFFESDPDSAIFFLTEINRDYPLTLSGEKSSFSIAWLYHYKLFNLEKSVLAYRSFIDSYPESQFFPEAEASLNALSSLLYSPEVDSTSQDSEIELLEKPELEIEE